MRLELSTNASGAAVHVLQAYPLHMLDGTLSIEVTLSIPMELLVWPDERWTVADAWLEAEAPADVHVRIAE